jgi:hypothetical protein
MLTSSEGRRRRYKTPGVVAFGRYECSSMRPHIEGITWLGAQDIR